VRAANVLAPEPAPLRVAICMWRDAHAKAYADHAVAINRAVAKSKGFDFFLSNTTYFADRSAAWQKIGMVLEKLRTGSYSHVVWVDADSAFAPRGGDVLHELLLDTDSEVVFASNLPFSDGFNSGVVVYTPSPTTLRMLSEVASDGLPNLDPTRESKEMREAVASYRPESTGHNEWPSTAALCQAKHEARQWEQDCLYAVINSPHFAEWKASRVSISTRIATVVIIYYNRTSLIGSSCPASKEQLHGWLEPHGRAAHSAVLHWAACEDWEREMGLAALHALHSEMHLPVMWRSKLS